jgi:hypothetical protein
MAKKTKKLAPIEASTHDQICSIPRDNLSAGDYWLLIDEGGVVMCEQPLGQAATAKIEMPRRQFNRLVRWYMTGKVTR